ncbi:MAG: transglutaminase family protein [Enterocloster sp.]
MQLGKIKLAAAAAALMAAGLAGMPLRAMAAEKDKTAVTSEKETAAIEAEIPDQKVPLYVKPAGSYVRTPIASGATTYKNEKAVLDASNVSEGYIMVKYTGRVGKIKVQVSKNGSETYTYDLNSSGAYEVFPLSEGSGSYQVKVFENIQGNQYSQAFSQEVNADIANAFGPFLYPNQYVNFNSASAAVQTAADISAQAQDQLGVVTAIYNYVITNLTYDTEKAQTVQSGYLPNVDVILAQKKGICFDYAALMTAMLRSQDIPSKLVIGYTGSLYHAWISVYLEGQGWVDNIIYFDGNSWKLMDPTFASSSGQSKEIMDYIGNGANYKAKYSY